MLLIALLAACAPRGELTLAPQAAGIGNLVPVYVATSRAPDTSVAGFGDARSETVSYARYDISIPPDRRPGQITWPNGTPDPATDFLTTTIKHHPDARAFASDLHRAVHTGGRGHDEAVIFVHGFNNTFSESLYRFAQLAHDIETPGVAVHFAWPSAANPLAYLYDRDSALFARDGLEQLIHQVQAAGADRIILAAHSLGASVTMETLRQLALRGDRKTLSRIRGVVLISPDIDVDVFRAQARTIGPLPQPFVIFASPNDRALGFLSRLNGQPSRLGNLGSIDRIADLDVTVVNTQAFNAGAGHFNPGDSPALLRILDQSNAVNDAFEGDGRGKTGVLPGVALTVRNATQIILAPAAATFTP